MLTGADGFATIFSLLWFFEVCGGSGLVWSGIRLGVGGRQGDILRRRHPFCIWCVAASDPPAAKDCYSPLERGMHHVINNDFESSLLFSKPSIGWL